MNNCEPYTLSEGPNYAVTYCRRCKRIGLFYNNLLVGYKEKEFVRFTRNFTKIDFDHHAVPFPDGSDRIIIKTPHQDIQINLDYQEFTELRKTLQESKLLLEAYELINCY